MRTHGHKSSHAYDTTTEGQGRPFSKGKTTAAENVLSSNGSSLGGILLKAHRTWPPPLYVPGTGSLVRNGSRGRERLAVTGTSCSSLSGEGSWLPARPHTRASWRAAGSASGRPGRKEAARSAGARATANSRSGRSGVQRGPPRVRCADHSLPSHRVPPPDCRSLSDG